MTTDAFLGYIEDLPVHRAERLLDATGAAHPTSAWYDGQVAVLRRGDGEDERPNEPTPFRLRLSDPDGAGSFTGALSPRGLHQKVAQLQQALVPKDRGYG